MDWGGLLSAGLGLFGQKVSSDSAKDAAQAQVTAAAIAAEQAKFKPYGVTTGFGSSFFDPEKGTAGYTLDPALAAYRDKLLGMGTQALPSSMDVNQATTDYYSQMQDIMAPQRAQQQAQLQQNVFGSGRLGMRMAGEGVGAGSGMVNPDFFGYNQALQQQNQKLAFDARQMAQAELDKQIARGTGLFTTGLGVEELGLKPLTLGAEFGGKSAASGAGSGNLLMTGATNAANANMAAAQGWASTLADTGATLGSMDWSKWGG